MSAVTSPDLRALPKAHLHVHLEGAMRRTTLADLATRYGETVPPFSPRFAGFAEFQALYGSALSVVRSFDDLSRLVSEVVEDAADDGAVWIEPAVHLPNHARLGPSESVLEHLLTASDVASKATGVGVGWLLTADRTVPPRLAVEQAAIAVRYGGQGVVGFGLANDESACPPAPFAEAFAVARQGGLICAPHAGEHGGSDSVRDALDLLGATRIQHGVRSIEDHGLIRRLVRDDVSLDVCPTSNVALSVTGELEHHPLPALLRHGVRCSINADDPLLFGVGLLDEYVRCRSLMGLGDQDLAECARTSITASGAPASRKESAYRGIDSWLAGGPGTRA